MCPQWHSTAVSPSFFLQPGAAQRLRFLRRNPPDSPKDAGDVPGDVPGLSTSIIDDPYVDVGSDDETLRLFEVT